MKAVISIGSNINDPKSNLDLAIGLLREATDVKAISKYFETEPVGITDQPNFLNAVVILESDLPATELLSLLHGIEKAMGRKRDLRWGPRNIDLDLIQYGSILSSAEELTLPHPRAHERKFVLAPWLSIDPDAELITHGRVDQLLKNLE